VPCLGPAPQTLRLYPSIPKNPKCAFHDDVLPDGTFIPRGSYVLYMPYVMGRLPSLWNDPPRFDPDRWADTAERL
jgi:long-chain fatty acid omega-monooxygenase